MNVFRWFWCLCLGLLLAAPLAAEVATGSFQGEIKKTVAARYLVHLPTEYKAALEGQPHKMWPLILFLHGAGERGEDLSRIRNLDILQYAASKPDFPFIVAVPQVGVSQDWQPDMLSAFLDHIQKEYRVDERRIYVTGYSMGGAGTWALGMHASQRFAAIAPLCGRLIPLRIGNLWRTPVWVFHGKKDEVVPFGQSEEAVEFLKGMGNEEVRFTIYPEDGHEIWPKVYQSPEIYQWFLSHSLPEAAGG